MPSIKLKDKKTGFGVVRVLNPDGSLNRAYRITQAEVDDVNASPTGAPPGCTKDEWESGLAKLYGGCLDEGEWQVRANGSLRVCVAVVESNGDLVSKMVELGSDEFTGEPAKAMGTDKLKGSADSLLDGVLTWH